jgi:hypothetical protein
MQIEYATDLVFRSQAVLQPVDAIGFHLFLPL